MSEDVSICIPVGPQAHYKRYLPECLASLTTQTLRPAGVTLIDDMAGLTEADTKPLADAGIPFTVWRSPWLLGIPGCANMGIALGMTDLVFQLSCDDRLMPGCVEQCWREWCRRRDKLGYYWVDIEYSTGERQSLPTGHALVPKALWRHTGGFPPEAGVGACDHIYINMLMSRPEAGNLYHVPGGALYWHREHGEQYTKHQNCHPSTIADVRTIYAQRWASPNWGRMEP